jgi:precorrin-2 dehydrogenase/sirohydrochlorin ferrochelatase
MKAEVFPIALHLDGRAVVVVGSGPEAVKRTRALIDAGARVTLVAERPSDEVRALASAEPAVALVERAFEDADLDGAWLAVVADLDDALARRAGAAAEARSVFFCAVDQPGYGSFSHLALTREGGVTVAISTSGRAPSLARRLRQELERLFREADLEGFVRSLSELRGRTPSKDRARVLGQAVAGVKLTGKLELPAKPEPPAT